MSALGQKWPQQSGVIEDLDLLRVTFETVCVLSMFVQKVKNGERLKQIFYAAGEPFGRSKQRTAFWLTPCDFSRLRSLRV